jgi:probable HAF family extracellular repeat protein
VGYCALSGTNLEHGFIWHPATGILALPNGSQLNAGINRSGRIAGIGPDGYAWTWFYNGRAIELGTFGGWALASAVNNLGHVAGYSQLQPGGIDVHSFYWTRQAGGKDIGTLGGSITEVTDLNDFNQMVGFSYTTGDLESHAILWSPTLGIVDLDGAVPGWQLFHAAGINRNGWIVGTGFNGQVHGFLLKP